MAASKARPRPGRKPVYTDLPPNLVSTFKQVATREGAPMADVLARLNSALGTNYTHSALCSMERGDRRPSPALINYMLAEVVPVLLVDAGLSRRSALNILKKIRLSMSSEQ